MTKDNHKYGTNTGSRGADGTFGPATPEGPGGSATMLPGWRRSGRRGKPCLS